MLTRLLLIVTVLIGVQTCASNPASAWKYGVAGAACPQALDINSYCSTSLGGNFQVTEASLRQSGQTWSASANWNRCGIDYKCGYYSATASLTPATSINSVAPACTYSATGGSTGGPLITCSATSNLTITGVDFTNSGGGTGTDCVPLDMSSGQTGTVTIKNSKFKDGPDCANNNQGVGSYLILGINSSTANFDFEYNNIDGGKDTSLANCVTASFSGAITIAHNAVIHCNSQPFQIASATAPTSITSYANFVEGFIYQVGGLHGEFWIAAFDPSGIGGSSSGSTGAWTSTVDTVVQDSDNVSVTTLIYDQPNNNTCQAAAPAACSFSSVTNNYLFGVTNKNASAAVSSFAVSVASGTFGSVTITNSLIDQTGILVGAFGIGGSSAFTFHGTTNGTTTVTVTSGDPTGQAGNVLTSANGDITPGTAIVSANSTTVVLSQAATGSHANQLITTYNTYCSGSAATLSGNKDLVTGSALNSWSLNNSLASNGSPC